MAVVHWDPTRDVSLLQGDMNRLFERFFGPANGETRTQRWVPAMDVVEEQDHYILRTDLPGMDQDDITVEIHDRQLTISGERAFESKPENDGGYVRLERSFGTFQRTLNLPEGVDPDAIAATFERGVLELRIPKPVAARPRRIQIGGERTEIEADSSEARRSLKERVLSK